MLPTMTFFCVRNVLLLDRSGGLASRPISHWISFHFNPPFPTARKHEPRLNPQKDRFGLCHQSESIATQVCFWRDKCLHRAKKQTSIVWKGLLMDWSRGNTEDAISFLLGSNKTTNIRLEHSCFFSHQCAQPLSDRVETSKQAHSCADADTYGKHWRINTKEHMRLGGLTCERFSYGKCFKKRQLYIYKPWGSLQPVDLQMWAQIFQNRASRLYTHTAPSGCLYPEKS